MILALLALLNSPAAAPSAVTLVDCQGDSTTEVDACLLNRETRALTTLAKYQAAVRARLAREMKASPPVGPEATSSARFDAAETAWAAYREAECGAVFDYWRAGTIRVSREQICRIRLTVQHTHTIWREWLTFPDQTPPLLPEPAALER
jgi:uncharacterized protein YecT (DUF1311 family)